MSRPVSNEELARQIQQLTSTVKQQGQTILELRGAIGALASKDDLRYVRQELRQYVDWHGRSPQPQELSSPTYGGGGLGSIGGAFGAPEPQGAPGEPDNIALFAAMSVLDQPGGSPSVVATEAMKQRVASAFQRVVREVSKGPKSTAAAMTLNSWWQQMLKVDAEIDLESAGAVDLSAYLSDMEKAGLVRWSRSSGDGGLPFPTPSFEEDPGLGRPARQQPPPPGPQGNQQQQQQQQGRSHAGPQGIIPRAGNGGNQQRGQQQGQQQQQWSRGRQPGRSSDGKWRR